MRRTARPRGKLWTVLWIPTGNRPVRPPIPRGLCFPGKTQSSSVNSSFTAGSLAMVRRILLISRRKIYEGGSWHDLAEIGDGKSPIPVTIYQRVPEHTIEKLRLSGLDTKAHITEIEVYSKNTPGWLDIRGRRSRQHHRCVDRRVRRKGTQSRGSGFRPRWRQTMEGLCHARRPWRLHHCHARGPCRPSQL